MDIDTVRYLASLSKLGFTEEQLEKTAAEMTGIIALMDSIKAVDVACGTDGVCGGESPESLRPDEVQCSMPAEKVLANAAGREGAFVVPRVVE